jgi:xylan 1,4-beta-xylosidase
VRLRWGRLGLIGLLSLLAAAAPARAGLLEQLLKPDDNKPPQQSAPTYQNPVLTGDYPDPSVIRAPDGWWAAVTSDGWMPPYSILYSSDLINWRVIGSVLRRRPAWARDHFWAPEIVHRGDRFLVYYAARSKRGLFCIGVAWSRRASGPYRDEGPLVCPELGAIDPLPVLDEAGRPNLVWKEDGNATGRPTPIVAAPLTPDGLALAGPWRELFRNDAPWESQIVEAPSLTRHAGRFYMLYSGGRCCGPSCDYATGVARSEKLYGRWEKHPGPILSSNSTFRCPGHGSVADGTWGREYFVYHAYSTSEPLLVGRQLLVDRLRWDSSGWPSVNQGRGPSHFDVSPLSRPQRARRPAVDDEFSGRWLDPAWQWPSERTRLRLDRSRGGRLVLRAGRLPAIAGRQPSAATYAAEAVVGRRSGRARPGLAVYTAREKAIGIELRKSRVAVWRSRQRRERTLASMPLPRTARPALRLEVADGRYFTFKVLVKGGWRTLGPRGYRPPFWLAVPRVVLRVGGARRSTASFERFRLAARASAAPLPAPRSR